MMKISSLDIPGLKVIELKIFGDKRGFFVERFNDAEFAKLGVPTHFAQDNHSRSAPGVLRGLHYQFGPPQGKLISVVRGRIWDVAVDIRSESKTFGKSFGIELSDMNGLLLWIPPGFAHGFSVLGDEPADVLYKVDNLYNPKGEAGIKWNDPELAVDWKLANPTISARDEVLPSFAEYRKNPVKW